MGIANVCELLLVRFSLRVGDGLDSVFGDTDTVAELLTLPETLWLLTVLVLLDSVPVDGGRGITSTSSVKQTRECRRSEVKFNSSGLVLSGTERRGSVTIST